MIKKENKYDLEERTAKFAEKIIELCKKAPKNKIFICKKESKETKYWLRMLAKTDEYLKEECQQLWKEAQEFTLIFSKIAISTK